MIRTDPPRKNEITKTPGTNGRVVQRVGKNTKYNKLKHTPSMETPEVNLYSEDMFPLHGQPKFSSSNSLKVGKTKKRRPFAVLRAILRSSRRDIFEPTSSDFDILSELGTDEILLRLSKFSLAAAQTDIGKTELGKLGLTQIERHLRGAYIASLRQ